jgi:hypothetical protein
MAFKYVSGAPVKNAVGYTLAKVQVDNDTDRNVTSEIDILETKMARQYFLNVGMITASIDGQTGGTAKPSSTTKAITVGGSAPPFFVNEIKVYPLMKMTVEGKKYYFEVHGEMNVFMTNGNSSSNVSFKGVYNELNSPDPVTVGFKQEGHHIVYDNEVFYLVLELTTKANEKTEISIPVFKTGGDTDISDVTITPNAQGYKMVSITCADDEYRHTDFIEVSALADSVVGPANETDNNNKLYCVGNLNDPNNNNLCVIAFYSAMDYSKCVKTLTYDEIEGYAVNGQQYLKASQIQFMAEKAGTDARYVIFSSKSMIEGEDQVGVGIYFPLQYENIKSGDYIAVKAEGDEFIYKDSVYSKAQKYTG